MLSKDNFNNNIYINIDCSIIYYSRKSVFLFISSETQWLYDLANKHAFVYFVFMFIC